MILSEVFSYAYEIPATVNQYSKKNAFVKFLLFYNVENIIYGILLYTSYM